MSFDTIQQLIRIVMYTVGAVLFGQGFAEGEMWTQVIGATVNIAAFVWWYIWDRGHKHLDLPRV